MDTHTLPELKQRALDIEEALENAVGPMESALYDLRILEQLHRARYNALTDDEQDAESGEELFELTTLLDGLCDELSSAIRTVEGTTSSFPCGWFN